MTDAKISLPDYAYIPGQTPRHNEGAFDALRNTVCHGMTPEDMADTPAFHAGFLFLERGFYWEAHEVLEPVWMNCPPNSAEKVFMQGVIQLANAALKVRMNRPNAALRLCDIAQAHFDSAKGAKEAFLMGHKIGDFINRVNDTRESLSMHNNADIPVK